jgi:hypothetical protein
LKTQEQQLEFADKMTFEEKNCYAFQHPTGALFGYATDDKIMLSSTRFEPNLPTRIPKGHLFPTNYHQDPAQILTAVKVIDLHNGSERSIDHIISIALVNKKGILLEDFKVIQAKVQTDGHSRSLIRANGKCCVIGHSMEHPFCFNKSVRQVFHAINAHLFPSIEPVIDTSPQHYAICTASGIFAIRDRVSGRFLMPPALKADIPAFIEDNSIFGTNSYAKITTWKTFDEYGIRSFKSSQVKKNLVTANDCGVCFVDIIGRKFGFPDFYQIPAFVTFEDETFKVAIPGQTPVTINGDLHSRDEVEVRAEVARFLQEEKIPIVDQSPIKVMKDTSVFRFEKSYCLFKDPPKSVKYYLIDTWKVLYRDYSIMKGFKIKQIKPTVTIYAGNFRQIYEILLELGLHDALVRYIVSFSYDFEFAEAFAQSKAFVKKCGEKLADKFHKTIM